MNKKTNKSKPSLSRAKKVEGLNIQRDSNKYSVNALGFMIITVDNKNRAIVKYGK